MILHKLLAVTDFSSQGDSALERAALLCVEHGASLDLACPGEPPPLDANERLGHHALQLGRRHDIAVRAAGQPADDADLVVWGAAPVRNLRSLFAGQPVQALPRLSGRPTLVVRRRATRAYGSMLVAVDFTDASRRLVEFALAFSPSADVELFHAIDMNNENKLRYAEVSVQSIKAYRDACRRHAQNRLFWLTDSTSTRRNRVYSAIGHGDPARQAVVQQQNSGAELVVVGKHPASALSDFVFGSVAQRVLRYGQGDVLVVPHDHAATANRPSKLTAIDSLPIAS
jgi:nucleotide-binding universal stress UspA family protein